MNKELCLRTLENLRRRGFEADFVETSADALRLVLQEAESAQTVGWGGSETLRQIGARDELTARGKVCANTAASADLFLLSANALLTDGRIVNIDGTCNRISASLFGPKRVVYVIGENKIVDGSLDDAIARIHREACPPNARRLGRQTPCGLTGTCTNCDAPDRMCRVIAILERKPARQSARVLLVGEKLGF